MRLLKHSFSSNQALIADLYLQYGPALLMYIRRNVASKEDAEDLFLEVFQAALESDVLRNLSERQQKSWLWSVAHNKIVDHHRLARRRPVAPLEEAAETCEEDTHALPELFTLRHEAQDVLRAHIATLNEQQQKILSLRFAHGLHSSEIARLLNKSDSAIRVMLSRTLQLLRNKYQEHGEEKHNES